MKESKEQKNKESVFKVSNVLEFISLAVVFNSWMSFLYYRNIFRKYDIQDYASLLSTEDIVYGFSMVNIALLAIFISLFLVASPLLLDFGFKRIVYKWFESIFQKYFDWLKVLLIVFVFTLTFTISNKLGDLSLSNEIIEFKDSYDEIVRTTDSLVLVTRLKEYIILSDQRDNQILIFSNDNVSNLKIIK